jgi:hypothetical protein
MADEQETAGTPNQDGRDAAESTPTTGTPGAEDRNAQGSEVEKEHLAWKQKAERVNELEKELEAERQRVAALERARQTQPATAGTSSLQDRYASLLEKKQAAIEGGHIADELRIDSQIGLLELEYKMAQQNEVTLQEIANSQAIDRISDPALREEVRKEFNDNRRLYGTAEVARDVVLRRKLEAENADLRKRLDTQGRREAHGNDVVRTEVREAPTPASQGMKFETWDDYDRKLEEIRARDGDRAARLFAHKNAKRENIKRP